MTNQQIYQTALLQSSYDCNCSPEDFCKSDNVVVKSAKNGKARVYLPLPLECDMVSYGSNIVAQCSDRLFPVVEKFVNSYPVAHCFETPNMRVLDDELQKFGLKICFMAEYFLPDVTKLKELPCRYTVKLLEPSDFQSLYTEQWSNALCKDRKQYDVLAVGAYDGDKLVALAGASADCDTMWQIGVDVLPDYRRQGIASALTGKLALEILKRGKVPFYCSAWCNVKSVRNALKCGFYPAWVELTARDADFVDKMNGR